MSTAPKIGSERPRSKDSDNNFKTKKLALALVVVGLTVAFDAKVLFRSSAIVGADGYYYAVQVRQLLNGSPLAYPIHTPLAFYILALFAHFWPIPVAIKDGAITFEVLLVLGCSLLVLAATRSSVAAAVSALLAAFSKSHWYFAAEFLKNAASLGFLLIGCSLMVFAWRRSWRPRQGLIMMAVIFAIASILSHVTSWVSIPAIAALSTLHIKYRERFYSWRLALTVLTCIWFGTWLLGVSRTMPFGGSAPNAALIHPALPIHLDNPACVPESLMLVVLVPAAFWLLSKRASEPADLIVGVVTWWTLTFTLNPCLDHIMLHLGAEGRIDHLAYLQVAILSGLILFRLRQKLGGEPGLVVICMLLLVGEQFTSFPHGLDARFIQAQAELEGGLRAHVSDIHSDWMLVTNQADRYVVAWVLPNHARIKATTEPFWMLLRDIDCTRGLKNRAIIITETGNQDACSILIQSAKIQSLYRGMNPAEARYVRARNLPLDDFIFGISH